MLIKFILSSIEIHLKKIYFNVVNEKSILLSFASLIICEADVSNTFSVPC